MNNDRYEKMFAELYSYSYDYVRVPQSVTFPNIEIALCEVYTLNSTNFCILTRIYDNYKLIHFHSNKYLAMSVWDSMMNILITNDM